MCNEIHGMCISIIDYPGNNLLFRKPPSLGPPLSLPECVYVHASVRRRDCAP